MARHFSVDDQSGIRVECTTERWFGHILDAHPEMAGLEELVRETLRAPEGIYQTATFQNRRAFHRAFSVPGVGPAQVRVIVEYNRRAGGSVTGTLITAFPADGPKQGEVRLWP